MERETDGSGKCRPYWEINAGGNARPINTSDARDWRRLSRAQLLQRGAKARGGALFARVAARLDDALACNEDGANRVRVPAEDRDGEDRGRREAFERGRFAVEHGEIGAPPGRELTHGMPGRLRATARGRAPQVRGDVGFGLVGGDVAHAMSQPLARLERAQLLERAHADVAVAA